MTELRNSSGNICRTLAHTLRRLFQSIKRQNIENDLDAPVEIIRKANSSVPYLPNISNVSLFPDFENPDLHANASPARVPSTFLSSQNDVNVQRLSRRTLLPTTSLSHLNLRQVNSDHSNLPAPSSCKLKPATDLQTVSGAKIGSIESCKPALIRQKSSLLIQRQSLYACPDEVESSASNGSACNLRRRNRLSNLRKCAKSQSANCDAPPLTPIPERSHASSPSTNLDTADHMVKHFASFCIIDISAPGCPITAVSEDLQYLYDVRDRFVLNAHECCEMSMDVSVCCGPKGEVTYVLLYSPLVSPLTSKPRYIMVSAIDVSSYIAYAATFDSNSEASEELGPSNFSEAGSSLDRRAVSPSWIDERTDRLADDLPHGCSIRDQPTNGIRKRYQPSSNIAVSHDQDSEDIWTTIAREEGLVFQSASERKSPSTGCERPDNTTSNQREATANIPSPQQATVDYSDEKILERFVQSLQLLYSEYFLLAHTPANDEFYEICYVSPAVYASGEWISGHLSHTPFNLIHEFSARLTAGERFQMTMRWGNQGLQKKLYCVPLTGQWICMLVEKDTPIRW